MAAEQPPSSEAVTPYLEALYDTIDARDGWVKGYASALSGELTDAVHTVVVAAARRGATDESVARAIRTSRIARTETLGLMAAADEASTLTSYWATRRREALGGRRHPHPGIVRREHLAARRKARGDSLDSPPLPDRRADHLTMAESDLLEALRGHGVGHRIGASAASAFRRVGRLLQTGRPDPELVDAIVDGTARGIRTELAYSLKALWRTGHRNALRPYHGDSLHSDRIAEPELQETEPETRGVEVFRWVTVMGDKACPSCQRRDGVLVTEEEMDGERFEPGGPGLLCNGSCLCTMDPDGWYEFPGRGPIPHRSLEVIIASLE